MERKVAKQEAIVCFEENLQYEVLSKLVPQGSFYGHNGSWRRCFEIVDPEGLPKWLFRYDFIFSQIEITENSISVPAP